MVIKVDSWNLIYCAVPKAGCSSVKAMLADIDPEVTLPPPEERTNRTYHEIYPTTKFRPRVFHAGEAYRFTMVRDPIKRLMSVFTNRVVEKRELHNSRRLKRRQVLPLDPDPDTFFQNLTRYAQLSSSIKHHAAPISRYTGPDLAAFDRIYRTDEMPDLAGFLSGRSGITVTAARANSSGAKLEFDSLTPETRDMLRQHLQPEYDYLAGVIDNPFS